VKLILLGTGTLHPEPNKASAGVAVEHEGELFLFDLGRGVLGRLADAGYDPLKLHYLHFSHLHPDHSCDLVPFLFALNYAPQPPRREPLHITAPEGFHDFYEHLRRAWRWIVPEFPLHVREAEEGAFQEGPATLRTAFMSHGDMANLGYRIEIEGKSVVYSGDTGPGGALLSLARGAHILVCECSFPDARAQAAHMSPTHLGQVAQAADCRKLVITHMYPGTDPSEVSEVVRRHYGGEIVIAHDGMTIEL
jgi:ribonuclease BN (tRNA processing enzyme)